MSIINSEVNKYLAISLSDTYKGLEDDFEKVFAKKVDSFVKSMMSQIQEKMIEERHSDSLPTYTYKKIDISCNATFDKHNNYFNDLIKNIFKKNNINVKFAFEHSKLCECSHCPSQTHEIFQELIVYIGKPKLRTCKLTFSWGPNNPLCFQSEIPKIKDIASKMLGNDWKAVENAECTDFTIVMKDGKKLTLHKQILCLRSEHFKTMFSGNFKNSNEITINKYSPLAVKNFFHFLYRGELLDAIKEDGQALTECLKIADNYVQDDFSQMCMGELERFLLQNETNMPSIQSWIDCALDIHLDSLAKVCINYLEKNHKVSDWATKFINEENWEFLYKCAKEMKAASMIEELERIHKYNPIINKNCVLPKD